MDHLEHCRDDRKRNRGRRPVELSSAELETLLEGAADPRTLTLTRLASTGARLGDLLDLRWTDVDVENQRIRLHVRKFGTTQTVPLALPVVAALEDLRSSEPTGRDGTTAANSEYVFATRRGRPTSLWELSETFRRHASLVLGRRISWHDLRLAAFFGQTRPS